MPVNADLEKERRGGSFDVEQLTYILDGSRDRTLRRRFLENIVLKDPVFDGPDTRFLSREEHFMELLRKRVALVKKLQELSIDDLHEAALTQNVAMNNDIDGMTLHVIAFIEPLSIMADDEQKKKWLIPAKKYEIIGCYAQTELGHGSFIHGLETRADYDVDTQQFILNTPTETATKWWIGGLGLVATHALLMAQLYIKDKCYGIHPFIVQLRDIRSHKLLPGVVAGDVGPKLGLAGVDNGFLSLYNVRIPRNNLLRKTGQVLEDGTYIKPENTKLLYGSMLGIRAKLPQMGAFIISKAVTIAIRYSCVRHQSELKPGHGEPQVLDYQTQQHKLFPLLAAAYAFHFVGEWMLQFHNTVMKEMSEGNFKRLAEDHVLSAGLKAEISWKVHEGIEVCRFSCGGHGYSLASGLPILYSNSVANSTAEGGTDILLLQTAVYLMKCLLDLQQGMPLDSSVTYLGHVYSGSAYWSHDVDMHSLLKAMQFRSKKLAENVSVCVQKELVESGSQQKALNRNKVMLVECAKAHIEAVIMDVFVSSVDDLLQNNPQIGKVLGVLCQIYGVTEILAHSGDYIEFDYLRKADLDNIQDQLFKMYTYIRPEAILLVDAFDIHDEVLKSVLGRYDGQVYENLFKWAAASPFNKQDHEDLHKYIQQLKQAKL